MNYRKWDWEPQKEGKISNNTTTSEEIAVGWETNKNRAYMGGKYLLEPEVLRSGKEAERRTAGLLQLILKTPVVE